MKSWKYILLVFILYASPIYAKELKILVTITPLYSLVTNVSGSLNTVELLIEPGASPHHYQLKPSGIKKIKNSDVIFAVGRGFEEFLSNNQNKTLSLINTQGLQLLSIRNQGNEENIDLHFWGNPYNAQIITTKIAEILSELDPKNKSIYSANAANTIKRINTMDQKVKNIINNSRKEKFIVSHDGYQYFEKYYNLHNVGIVETSHGSYGAKTIQRISKIVREEDVKCIFAEPQSSSHVITKIAESSGIKTGFLDIEGEGTSGRVKPQDIYFSMMEGNAKNFSNCFYQSQ
jgi:zinc transport system substrate-binding protein